MTAAALTATVEVLSYWGEKSFALLMLHDISVVRRDQYILPVLGFGLLRWQAWPAANSRTRFVLNFAPFCLLLFAPTPLSLPISQKPGNEEEAHLVLQTEESRSQAVGKS